MGMNTKGIKILTIILAGLAILTAIVLLSDNKKGSGNFKSMLAVLEKDQVNRIEILSSETEKSFVLLKNSQDDWIVQINGESYNADESAITSLLNQATNIKVKQVVSRSKDSWEKYSVSDSLGSFVSFYEDKDQLSAIIIGRMSFSQPQNPYQRQPNAITYVREKEEDYVYSTEGMLSMLTGRGTDYFRDGTIISAQKANMNRIVLNYPSDSSFVIAKADSIWEVNGMKADSTGLENYLNQLQNNSGRSFGEKSDISSREPLFEVRVEGDNMEPVILKAWPGNSKDEYFLTSSQNEGTVHKLSENQFHQLFPVLKEFLTY